MFMKANCCMIMLCWFVTAHAQNPTTPPLPANTQQQVQCTVVSECYVYAYRGTDSTNRTLEYVTGYNAAGREVTFTNATAAGRVAGYKKFSLYNTKGRLSSTYVEEPDFFVGGTKNTYTVYTYDARGNKSLETTFSFARRIKKSILHLQKCTVEEDEIEPFKTWALERTDEYVYDAQNRLTRHSIKTPYHTTYEYQYNALGQIVNITGTDLTDGSKTIERRKYLKDTIRHTWSSYNKDGSMKADYQQRSTLFEIFNAQKVLIEEYYVGAKFGITNRYTFQYDEKGRLLRKFSWNEDGTVSSVVMYDYTTPITAKTATMVLKP